MTGLIKEEILMYEDDPEWALDDEMRKNLFYELPIKEKIAGTVDSIYSITKNGDTKYYMELLDNDGIEISTYLSSH